MEETYLGSFTVEEFCLKILLEDFYDSWVWYHVKQHETKYDLQLL